MTETNTPAASHGRTFALAWAAVTFTLLFGMTIDLLPQFERLFHPPASLSEVDLAGKMMADAARILGVSLSMLVALVALAIPLTANVYTPKLIEIFVADRWNRIVLGYMVIGNAVALWNKFVISAGHPTDVRVRTAVTLMFAMGGLAIIVPYFLYVLRFLIPRSIVDRLRSEIVEDITRAAKTKDGEIQDAALEQAVTNVQYLGKITLRSLQRYDRDTALEGLDAMRDVFDHYQARKEYLPRAFFTARCRELLGLGPELALEVERAQATLEVAILQELSLLLPIAMDQVPEAVAQIAQLSRRMGVRTAERKDEGAREYFILYFNTFIRQGLKAKNTDAFYKFVYQYRRFAEQLLQVEPTLSCRIAFYLDYYAHQAARMGLGFLINVVAYDLAALVDMAYRIKSPVRRQLLNTLINLDRDEVGVLDMPGVVKAQIQLAARMKTRGFDAGYDLLLKELQKVPTPKLRDAFSQVIAAREENFWEIMDRRRHLDHIEPEFRPAVSKLRAALLGPIEPGVETLLYLGNKPKPPADFPDADTQAPPISPVPTQTAEAPAQGEG